MRQSYLSSCLDPAIKQIPIRSKEQRFEHFFPSKMDKNMSFTKISTISHYAWRLTKILSKKTLHKEEKIKTEK